MASKMSCPVPKEDVKSGFFSPSDNLHSPLASAISITDVWEPSPFFHFLFFSFFRNCGKSGAINYGLFFHATWRVEYSVFCRYFSPDGVHDSLRNEFSMVCFDLMHLRKWRGEREHNYGVGSLTMQSVVPSPPSPSGISIISTFK